MGICNYFKLTGNWIVFFLPNIIKYVDGTHEFDPDHENRNAFIQPTVTQDILEKLVHMNESKLSTVSLLDDENQLEYRMAILFLR